MSKGVRGRSADNCGSLLGEVDTLSRRNCLSGPDHPACTAHHLSRHHRGRPDYWDSEAVYPRLGAICSLFRRRPSHKQPGLRRRSSPPTSSGPSENLCTDGFQLWRGWSNQVKLCQPPDFSSQEVSRICQQGLLSRLGHLRSYFDVIMR